MNILIELNLNNSFSLASCVSGNINLCDGSGNLIVSGTSYLSGYLQEISPFAHSVNLLHGGNLEDYETFSFAFTDNGLTYELEKNDFSMNQGVVSLFTWDGTTKMPQWKGYVTGTELGENKVVINCENLSKGLKTLQNPLVYGKSNRLKLVKDTTINNKVFTFNRAAGVWSTHPNLIDIGSPQVPPANSNAYHKGMKRYLTTVTNEGLDTYITIEHTNDAFSQFIDANGVPLISIKAKWETGVNKGQSYKIGKIITNTDTVHWVTKLFLTTDFGDIDIERVDCLTVYENASFFEIPQGIEVSDVSIFSDDDYYSLDATTYSVITLNQKKYLKVFTNADIYREVPLTQAVLLSNTTISNSTCAAYNDINRAIDSDLDKYCEFVSNPTSNKQDSEVVIRLYPNLNEFQSRSIYFGAQAHVELNTAYINCRWSSTIKYNNAILSPCNDDGSKSYNEFLKNDLFDFAPIGDMVSPKTTSVLGMGPYSGGNYYPFSFHKSKLHKLPVEPEAYQDVSYIEISIRRQDISSGAIYGLNYGYIRLYKVGIYVTESIGDDLDTVYINTDGKCNYLIPALEFGAWPIGSNDAIAKDVLTTIGQQTTSDFKYNYSDFVMTSAGSYVVSGVDYNHFYANSGSKSSDVLETLAKEGLFVIASQEDGTIYSRPLSMHQDDSKVNLSIPADDILDIEPLVDVGISDIINLPTFNFTDSAGNTESVEVLSLELSAFPSLATINDNERNYNSVFRFSDNFLSILKSGSNSTEPICHAYNFLSVMWAYCWNSYKKNGISNSGSIEVSTYYLSELLNTVHGITDDCAQIMFFNLVKMNAMRRKILKFKLPLDYTISKKIRIGDRIKVYHPNIMQNSSIYGFVSTVETELLQNGNQITITLICDSYKLGSGRTDFFGI